MKCFDGITRPICALNRRTILCLHVSGFQRQIFEQVPKSKWIPHTKFLWIPSTNTCRANFVGTFVLLRIPQRAYIGSCSGFRKCRWSLQIQVESVRNVSGFSNLYMADAIFFITELAYEQLKARAEFLSIAMRNLKARNNHCQWNPRIKIISMIN